MSTETSTNHVNVTTASGTLGNAMAKAVITPREVRVSVGWVSEGVYPHTMKMNREQAQALADALQAALDETA